MSDGNLNLLEGHDYTVSTHGRDGRRFVGLFRRCWDAIPAADRRDILDHWDRRKGGLPPSFELSNLWGDSAWSHAQVKDSGYQLRFNADSFSIMPEETALFIIAHELAHVHGWASGKSGHRFKCLAEASSEEADIINNFEAENEASADALAVSWGFNKVARNTLRLLAEARGFESACRMMASAPNAAPGASPPDGAGR